MRRLLILTLASLFITLFLSTWTVLKLAPGSSGYHFVRRSLQYWGLGWCEPTHLPRREHHFPAEQSSGISWPGDEAFWREFPIGHAGCGRDAYRLWLPEPPAEGSPPPAPRDCSSLIVTALYDIGRAKWPAFARSVEEYMGNAATVMSLRNPMVIFTSPELAPTFVSWRRANGLMDRTLVLACDVHCTPAAWLREGATRVMCDARSTRFVWDVNTPERQEPWYNLVMWAKAHFFAAAASLPHAALNASWVTWLDAGCHPPMCSPAITGGCVDPAPWSRPDRIRIAQTRPIYDDVAALTPSQFVSKHVVTFAGTIFGTGRAHAGAAMDAFKDAVQWLLGRGVADTDQTVFAALFSTHPEALEAYPVFHDRWVDIVERYIGGTPVEAPELSMN